MKLILCRHTSLFFVALTFMVSSGCNQQSPERDAQVTGVVTINGELPNSGVVAFQPAKDGPVIYGTINDEGSYRLKAGKGSAEDADAKVPSGDYRVTVRVAAPAQTEDKTEGYDSGPPEPGKLLIPTKFIDPAETPLKYTIKPGDNVINIAIDFEAESLETDELDDDAEGEADEESLLESPESDERGDDSEAATESKSEEASS